MLIKLRRQSRPIAQTNAVVEQFNSRIEAVLKSHHFRSGEEREATLQCYVWRYSQESSISLGQHNASAND